MIIARRACGKLFPADAGTVPADARKFNHQRIMKHQISHSLSALAGALSAGLCAFASEETPVIAEQDFITMHGIACRAFSSYERTTAEGSLLIVWDFSERVASDRSDFEAMKAAYSESGRIRVVDFTGRTYLDVAANRFFDEDDWSSEVAYRISETTRAFLGKGGHPIFLVRKIAPPAKASARAQQTELPYRNWSLSVDGNPPSSLPQNPAIISDWYETGEGANVLRTKWQYRFSGSAPYYENPFTLSASCEMDCSGLVRISLSSDDTATLSVGSASVHSTLYSGSVSEYLPYSESGYDNLGISLLYENIGGPYSLEANVESLTE